MYEDNECAYTKDSLSTTSISINEYVYGSPCGGYLNLSFYVQHVTGQCSVESKCQ